MSEKEKTNGQSNVAFTPLVERLFSSALCDAINSWKEERKNFISCKLACLFQPQRLALVLFLSWCTSQKPLVTFANTLVRSFCSDLRTQSAASALLVYFMTYLQMKHETEMFTSFTFFNLRQEYKTGVHRLCESREWWNNHNIINRLRK